MYNRMSRAAWREGKTVKFQNIVGVVTGNEYKYVFQDERKAEEFLNFIKLKEGNGNPVPIGKEWDRYKI